ncbi:diguanylate cyclase (GGDEF)-like protein [Alkalibacillus flavidus]|uniref:Diguanylate cyclase (GGDEF)-like protein n=1 Tax=Alkalibacillus flavidus TaxID=546021 RepID=A0ABV2KRR5_9BACI
MFNKKDEHIEHVFAFARWLIIVGLIIIYMMTFDEISLIVNGTIFWSIVGVVTAYSFITHVSLKWLPTYSKAKRIMMQVGLSLDLLFYLTIMLITASEPHLLSPLLFIWLLHITLIWTVKVSMAMTVVAMAAYAYVVFDSQGLNAFSTLSFLVQMIFIFLIGMLASSMTIRKEAGSIDHIDYKEEAMKDYVSGLYNHRTFQNTLMKFVQQRKPLTVIKLNIDHFQSLNDRYGYEWGDRVLAIIGSTLDFWIEPQDGYSFRYNGDEFIIILFNQNRSHIEQQIEKWNNYIHEHVQMLEPLKGEQVTVSYGVATLMERDDRNELLRRVDRCVQQAKATGRHRAVFDESFQLETNKGR